jgi:hypothetical protein
VTLSTGDSASVVGTGKGVYIGQNANSNSNTLVVQGALTANTVTVGSAAPARATSSRSPPPAMW